MSNRGKKEAGGRGRTGGKNTSSRKKDVKKPFFASKSKSPSKKKGDKLPTFNENVRLNKYIANEGICSRREADVMIETGLVQINGKIMTEMGYKVKPTDEVKYDGMLISQRTKRYVLLNKPKDFVTSNDDAWGRKNVMQLVFKACKERIFPVDKMLKEATGLLLFTNDSDLSQKLNHPSQQKPRIYHVELHKNVNFDDMEKLMKGFEVSEGKYVKADKVEFVKDGKPKEVGVEIRSNHHRAIERLFDAVGYKVVRQDLVSYAGLTKLDLPRGNYRHLTESEVGFLKM